MQIPGYNAKRPAKEDYEMFEKTLAEGIAKLDIKGLSLMLYGSYVRGDYDIGRSDIDAVLIFPDDVVIDKQNLAKAASKVYSAMQAGRSVPFHYTVTDIATMKDGRFNPFDETFKKYFQEEARIYGTDYRNELKFEIPTMNEQVQVRFGLRNARNGLLLAYHDINEEYDAFIGKFSKSLDTVSRSSKQILSFTDGVLRKERFSALEEIIQKMPEVNTAPLKMIQTLYTKLETKPDPETKMETLDAIYLKPSKVLAIWNDALTFMEDMIKAYIDRNPRNE